MKNIFTLLLIFSIIGSCSFIEKQSAEPTLFERLGGTEGLTAIVDDVVEAHMTNPIISARFIPYKGHPEKLTVIKQHTVQFFSMGTGAQIEYMGKAMPDAHQGMNITAAEYIAVVDDILLVLEKHQIDKQSQNEVLAILWSLKGMIMGK